MELKEVALIFSKSAPQVLTESYKSACTSEGEHNAVI